MEYPALKDSVNNNFKACSVIRQCFTLPHIAKIVLCMLLELFIPSFDCYLNKLTILFLISNNLCRYFFVLDYLGRVKRIWYLSPVGAVKVQASLRSLARTSAARSYKQ